MKFSQLGSLRIYLSLSTPVSNEMKIAPMFWVRNFKSENQVGNLQLFGCHFPVGIVSIPFGFLAAAAREQHKENEIK